MEKIEKFFRLRENGTTFRTEVIAGTTTFLTMAYILAVNPSILSAAGMDSTAVMLATCLVSFVGTLLMGLLGNLPFAISAGMGLNAFFAYTVVLGEGYSWQTALFSVFVEGIIFIILSLTNVREAIFNSIPLALKRGISVGVGIFIAFIGLQNAGLSVSEPSTLVSMVAFNEDFHRAGICALLALTGSIATAVMHIRKVPGSVLIGIICTWVLGIICQLAGVYVPDNENYFSVLPAFGMTDFSALGKTFGQCFNIDLSAHSIFDFAVVVLSFLFVDIFDTLGTLIGIAAKADMLDDEGKFPKIKPALLADAISTSVGAVLGTSTASSFVESSAGVSVGGRTGLTAVTTAVLFLLSMFLAPLFVSIPSFATAPALIFVGFLMFTTITKIPVDDENQLTECIPAYLAIISMPLFYSISAGIGMGVVSYVAINLCCGKKDRISPVMYILAAAFILQHIFL